jgi:hypothetical protein
MAPANLTAATEPSMRLQSTTTFRASSPDHSTKQTPIRLAAPDAMAVCTRESRKGRRMSVPLKPKLFGINAIRDIGGKNQELINVLACVSGPLGKPQRRHDGNCENAASIHGVSYSGAKHRRLCQFVFWFDGVSPSTFSLTAKNAAQMFARQKTNNLRYSHALSPDVATGAIHVRFKRMGCPTLPDQFWKIHSLLKGHQGRRESSSITTNPRSCSHATNMSFAVAAWPGVAAWWSQCNISSRPGVCW